MVGSVIPVIATGEVDGWPIAWLHMWAAPILLDPNWSDGDYYGKAEPARRESSGQRDTEADLDRLGRLCSRSGHEQGRRRQNE